MLWLIIKFIIGLIALLIGANYLVEGATAIARRLKISDMVIGMTIVAIGTSTPEMVVSFIGAVKGNSDIAMGNVIGSNICNILLVLGAAITIRPIMLNKSNLKYDIPFILFSSVIILFLSKDTTIFKKEIDILSRLDGIILVILFALFMLYSFTCGNKNKQEEKTEVNKDKSIISSSIMIIVSLVALIWGGDFMVDNATLIARQLGISDMVIASTIVAIGTSAPELATTIIAATKQNTGIALGNVVGSNIINIFLILGGSAIITPLNLSNITPINYIILIVSALLLYVFAKFIGKGNFSRIEGIILLIVYTIYIYTLL